MKIVVTHHSPDWDAITSVWLIKKFLLGWHDAAVQFVPAGNRLGERGKGKGESKLYPSRLTLDPIEKIGQDEVIHVDTGLGPLDHHQTQDQNVCGASLTFDYVRGQTTEDGRQMSEDRQQKTESERHKYKMEAVDRIVKVVVDIDHFKEVFWKNPTADYHEFSLLGVLEGLKLAKPDEDMYYMDVGMTLLDALLHNFENRIWAEKEIAEHGIKFKTKWGEGIGFETINDSVLPLSQKMGYVLVVRKDPRKGYVRIKARPSKIAGPAARSSQNAPASLNLPSQGSNADAPFGNPSLASPASTPRQISNIDLTLAYEKLRKMDPEATWFLHVSKKMLLNGTVKNPTMRPTTLSLEQIIKVLEKV